MLTIQFTRRSVAALGLLWVLVLAVGLIPWLLWMPDLMMLGLWRLFVPGPMDRFKLLLEGLCDMERRHLIAGMLSVAPAYLLACATFFYGLLIQLRYRRCLWLPWSFAVVGFIELSLALWSVSNYPSLSSWAPQAVSWLGTARSALHWLLLMSPFAAILLEIPRDEAG